jgi:Putative Ig domain
MNIPCTNIATCEPDAALENLSSEIPDSVSYYGTNTGPNLPKPPIDGYWTTTHCLGYCVSHVSQADADACAARENIKCLTGPVDPGNPNGTGGWTRPAPIPPGKPLPPGAQPPGTGNSLQTYDSKEEECTVYCPDGTPSLGKAEAGQYIALSQAAADNAAKGFACGDASLKRICFGTIEPRVCLTHKYASTLTVTGFNPPYKFTITKGTLPPGLTIESSSLSTALISGTTSQSGQFDFTITAIDLTNNARDHDFTISVQGLADDTDTDFPDAQVGVEYGWQFEADGGVEPYTYKVSEPGALPGLTLDSDGFLHGSPTEAGIKEFIVIVTDSTGYACTETLSLDIQAALMVEYACANVFNAIVFTVYQGQLPPIVFAPQSGEIPDGMDLLPHDSTSAILSGIPFPAGTYEFTVRATDSLGNKVDQPVQYNVLGIVNAEDYQLPGGTVNVPYSYQLQSLGANPLHDTYTYAILSGTMPSGLTLHTSGLIDGTPTAEQTPTVVVRVTDGSGNFCNATLNFKIHPVPPVNFANIATVSIVQFKDGICSPFNEATVTRFANQFTTEAFSCPAPVNQSNTSTAIYNGILNYDGPLDTVCFVDVLFKIAETSGKGTAASCTLEVRSKVGGIIYACSKDTAGGDICTGSPNFTWGQTGGGITIQVRSDGTGQHFATPPPSGGGGHGACAIALYPAGGS